MKDTKDIVGANIKLLRESMGLRQRQVADYLEVDQSLISKVEAGERSISTDILEALSSLFCCPVSNLLSEQPLEGECKYAFRSNHLSTDDLKAIAAVNRIALNQIEMDNISTGVSHD